MSNIPPQKLAEWKERAARKSAIVPQDFEVFPDHALIVCGNCGTKFSRNLVPQLNEPTFVCPSKECGCKNWLPVKFERG